MQPPTIILQLRHNTQQELIYSHTVNQTTTTITRLSTKQERSPKRTQDLPYTLRGEPIDTHRHNGRRSLTHVRHQQKRSQPITHSPRALTETTGSYQNIISKADLTNKSYHNTNAILYGLSVVHSLSFYGSRPGSSVHGRG